MNPPDVDVFQEPFRHAVIDNFISAEQVSEINANWPTYWSKKTGKTSIKWHTSELPPAARAVADSVRIATLEEITGICGLIADPELFGAGLHCIPAGGYLKMHVDFNAHPRGWHRRVNVLIYLNERWEQEWGGHLQLGLDKPKRITPIAGRCVIFETNDESWHGHPLPLACPDDVQRRSLALYYYTPEPPKEKSHTTIYRKD